MLVVQRKRAEDGACDRKRRRQDLLEIVGDRHYLPDNQHGEDTDRAADDPAALLAFPARTAVGRKLLAGVEPDRLGNIRAH
jgi:hypothetical protein